MTMRRIYGCVKMIRIRQHNEYASQGALRGIKIETKKIRRKIKEIEPELEETRKEKIADMHAAAIKRIVEKKTSQRK